MLHVEQDLAGKLRHSDNRQETNLVRKHPSKISQILRAKERFRERADPNTEFADTISSNQWIAITVTMDKDTLRR